MYCGKLRRFGQRFIPPTILPYLRVLAPYAGNYSRSRVALSLILEDVKKFRPADCEPDDPCMRLAMSRAARAFLLDKPVRLLHLCDVFKQDLTIWSSSPGLPWIQQGIHKNSEIRDNPEYQNRVRLFWHCVKTGKPVSNDDCCAVWGYPATMLFGEAVFAVPLIEAYSELKMPIAYRYETGVGGCMKLYHEMKGYHFLGIDYKSFDKTVPTWLIRTAFDIMFFNLDFVRYRDYGITHFDGIMRMWEHIIDYFVNTPIRLRNGERYRKKGGIASGSYFAQLVGSIINYILMQYFSIKTNTEIQSIKVLDDDLVADFARPIYPPYCNVILR